MSVDVSLVRGAESIALSSGAIELAAPFGRPGGGATGTLAVRAVGAAGAAALEQAAGWLITAEVGPVVWLEVDDGNTWQAPLAGGIVRRVYENGVTYATVDYARVGDWRAAAATALLSATVDNTQSGSLDNRVLLGADAWSAGPPALARVSFSPQSAALGRVLVGVLNNPQANPASFVGTFEAEHASPTGSVSAPVVNAGASGGQVVTVGPLSAGSSISLAWDVTAATVAAMGGATVRAVLRCEVPVVTAGLVAQVLVLAGSQILARGAVAPLVVGAALQPIGDVQIPPGALMGVSAAGVRVQVTVTALLGSAAFDIDALHWLPLDSWLDLPAGLSAGVAVGQQLVCDFSVGEHWQTSPDGAIATQPQSGLLQLARGVAQGLVVLFQRPDGSAPPNDTLLVSVAGYATRAAL